MKTANSFQNLPNGAYLAEHNYNMYSYYRNTVEKRVFLLTDCPTTIMLPGTDYRVQLIEWGKSFNERIELTPYQFQDLIDKGLMEAFTPKFQD